MELTKSQMINRIAELAQENAELQGKLDAYKMSENEANEIIAELKAENERLKEKIRTEKIYSSQVEELEESLNHLKQENERLEHLDEEINDFISDISTCGFKYDDRCPDNLDELQCCIEDLCNKFSNYKQTLQEIKTIVEENKDTAQYGGVCRSILTIITKAEEE